MNKQNENNAIASTRREHLATFDFRDITLRTVLFNGEPWFSAPDACSALGMNTSKGTYNWLKGVAPDHRRLIKRGDVPQIFWGTSTAASATLLNEAGLYTLIMRSTKPEAKAFQDWVTGTVLPAIRKDGGYIDGEEKFATGEMSEDELVFKAMHAPSSRPKTAPERALTGC